MTTTSPAAISIVHALQGTATVRRADGRVEPLKVGDAIYPGDEVLTPPGSSVELRADDTGAAALPADAAAWNPAPGAPVTAKAAAAGREALDEVLKAIDRQDPEAAT